MLLYFSLVKAMFVFSNLYWSLLFFIHQKVAGFFLFSWLLMLAADADAETAGWCEAKVIGYELYIPNVSLPSALRDLLQYVGGTQYGKIPTLFYRRTSTVWYYLVHLVDACMHIPVTYHSQVVLLCRSSLSIIYYRSKQNSRYRIHYWRKTRHSTRIDCSYLSYSLGINNETNKTKYSLVIYFILSNT